MGIQVTPLERAKSFARPIVVILALSLSSPSTSGASSVTVSPIRDNSVFEDPAGALSNGAGPALFAGVNGTGLKRRALLEFDVAGAVPTGATIDSVMLVLHVSQVSDPSSRVMTLHRLRAEWGEGTSSTSSGSGAAATDGDATWLHASYPDSLWALPGGDFESIGSASTTVGGLGFYSWSGPGITDDVRTWIDEPDSNHGWILIGDESTSGTTRKFDSREIVAAENRPALVIFHSLVSSPVSVTSWGTLKTRHR